jgi:fatty-acyl-CoA synthase
MTLQSRPIATLADIERIESGPYADYMPHRSLHAALSDSATRHAGRTALRYVQDADAPERTQAWTYRDFIAEVRRTANLFRALAGGDVPRVAILLPAIPQGCFALWGAEVAGVACPINYLLDSAHIAGLIRASGANILVALGPNAELAIWPRVADLQAQCPGLKQVLAVGVDGTAPPADALCFDTARAAQPGDALAFERPVQADTLAALFHTGGTTGAPKLAQHTHGNQLHTAWSAAQLYAMDERDVVVNGFPIFHVAGSLVYGLSTLLSGAELLLPTLLGLRNTRYVQRYWTIVERHHVTLLAAVPTVIATLLNTPTQGADLGSVRALYTGGSPLPPELATAFEQRHGIPVRNILGMTECAGVVAIEPYGAPRAPGSCGLRLPYTEVQAVPLGGDGASTDICAAGVSGVLRLRGPHVSPGYTDVARDAGTFDSGWLLSGDIGHVDAQGRVFVTGRAKDVIIRSGHNIEPGLIEEALMRHPEVAFAAAVGAPDEYAGEVPVAYVVLKAGAAIDAAGLLDFVRQHIAEPPAQPKHIDLLDALPQTAVGKVYKPALRMRAIERVIRDRLARAGLQGRVDVQGQEGASGLSLQLVRQTGVALAEVDAAARAVMAPYALRWSWSA